MEIRTPPRSFWFLVAGIPIVALAAVASGGLAVGLLLVIAVGFGSKIAWWVLTIFWGISLLWLPLFAVPVMIGSPASDWLWLPAIALFSIVMLLALRSLRAHCGVGSQGHSPRPDPALS